MTCRHRVERSTRIAWSAQETEARAWRWVRRDDGSRGAERGSSFTLPRMQSMTAYVMQQANTRFTLLISPKPSHTRTHEAPSSSVPIHQHAPGPSATLNLCRVLQCSTTMQCSGASLPTPLFMLSITVDVVSKPRAHAHQQSWPNHGNTKPWRHPVVPKPRYCMAMLPPDALHA